MNVVNRRIFALVLAGCAVALANCSGGSVSIPANHPGGTPVPTVSPTVRPSSTASASPSPSPSASPTAKPSGSPSASPSPSSSPTTAACGAPPPDPNATQVPILGQGPAQPINVPCYQDFTGTATIPAGTTITGPTSALLAVTSDHNAFGITDDPNAGTRLLTTSIGVTALVTLGNPMIPTVVTSPTMINPGHIYEAELYLSLGGAPFPEPQDFQLNLVPTGHSISFNVTNPAGNSFPPGPTAYVIIYQNN